MSDAFYIKDRKYGKADVRLVRVTRNGRVHNMKEMRVRALLKLNSIIDYTTGDNKDIIATDSIKNTVYVLAKEVGVASAERFAIILSEHFLKYSQVIATDISIEENVWSRITEDGRPHNHAFTRTSDLVRTAHVTREKGKAMVVQGGVKNLRVMKTTQSGFEGFVRDRYRTLPDTKDRIFNTIVGITYDFNRTEGVDFDGVFDTVLKSTFKEFAGPTETGTYSPSVQNAIHLVQTSVLQQVPQIESVYIEMPNRHCIPFNLAPFGLENNNEVFIGTDEPAGFIQSTLARKVAARL